MLFVSDWPYSLNKLSARTTVARENAEFVNYFIRKHRPGAGSIEKMIKWFSLNVIRIVIYYIGIQPRGRGIWITNFLCSLSELNVRANIARV